jgi:putative membrane protein
VISFDPAGVVVVGLLMWLHLRAVRTLARRGHRVPRWQQAAWHAGVALIAVGLFGPLDDLGEDLLVAHMGQHLLVGDLAAPLLLVGMRSPVLYFMLPRPLFVALARRPRLRAVSRFVRRPLPALGLYLLLIYAWHLSFAFEGALESNLVHGLQHESFLLAGVLIWWPVLEPNRMRLRGELWKAGYVLGTRVMTMFVGMAFLIMRSPAYGWYEERGGAHGLSPLDDQQLAGGLMMSVDLVIMLGALAFFFWRAGVDHDRAEAERSERAATATG